MSMLTDIKEYFSSQNKRIWTPLYVLMWKHFIERKHRYWHTIVEIFEGCLVFFVLFLVRQSLLLKDNNHPETLRILRNGSVTVVKVCYMPRNNFTEHFMDTVIYQLNSNSEPIVGWRSRISWELANTPFHDEREECNLFCYFWHAGPNATDLSYSLKILEDRRKSNKSKFNGYFDGEILSDDLSSPFLGPLQWAIDKSFMERFLSSGFKYDLHFRQNKEYIPKDLAELQNYIIVCTVIAPLPFFIYKTSTLNLEKRTGLQHLMGLSGVSSCLLRMSHLLDTVFIGIVYGIIISFILKMSENPILPYSNITILTFTIMLYFLNLNALAFFTSTLLSNNTHSNSLAVLIYICSLIFDFSWHPEVVTSSVLRIALTILLPHASAYMFWDEVCRFELAGIGMNFFKVKDVYFGGFKVLELWFYFVVHLFILMTVEWYLDAVMPRDFGIPKKWNFIFQRNFYSFKKGKRVNFNIPTVKRTEEVARDEKFFERGPQKANVAINFVNVSKVFKTRHGEVRALDKISLDVYKGEVTMILGLNGAGKTTLLSMLTGRHEATSGSVYVQGLDTHERTDELCNAISLCPQTNRFHIHLNVRENIKFFEKLKSKKNNITADALMEQLNIKDMAKFFPYQLSSGALRSLQVACAVVGGEDVIVLDEPTSGMDLDTRHRLWDLIMQLRGEKTILMSTMFLEEADALGDRIAVMSKGKLRCHGSPSFLKHAMGTGFNLTITLQSDDYKTDLDTVIENTIPNVKCKYLDNRRLSYMLPEKENDRFPALFDTLEAKRTELGIAEIDVGMFIEELLLQFVEDEFKEHALQACSFFDVHLDQIEGCRLLCRQFRVLIMRIYHYLWMHKYQFIILQILVPIIGFIIITITTNCSHGYDGSHEPIMPNRILYDMGPYRRSALSKINMYGIRALSSKNVEADINKPLSGNRRASGFTMSDNGTKIIVSTNPWKVTKTVNIFSNLFMNLHMPYHNGTITTTYMPRSTEALKEPKSVFLCLKWSVWILYLSVIPLAPFILLSIWEQLTGSRTTHIMAGCSLVTHWTAKLIAHMSVYMTIVPFPLILITKLFDYDKTFDNMEFCGTLLLLSILFALAFLAHLYVLSFMFKIHSAVGRVIVLSLGFGIIMPILKEVLDKYLSRNDWFKHIFQVILMLAYFSPMYPFGVSLIRLTLQARLNAYCNLNKQLCPNFVVPAETFSTEICCKSTSSTPFGYLSIMSATITTLIVHFVLYSFLVVLLEMRIIHYGLEHLVNYNYVKPKQMYTNYGVIQESKLIEDRYEQKDFTNEVLIARQLHKRYYVRGKRAKNNNAVTGVSLMAKKGECIGILGPTGSGKSSMLLMLAGITVMTEGESWVNGFSIRKDRNQYVQQVAIASSSGGVDHFLTGTENLILISLLQGHSKHRSIQFASVGLRNLGLHQYSDVLVSNYNRGCLRRLSLCMVNIISPEVAFIDEPMLDVDPITKILVTEALEKLIAEPTTVLVAEASLDWHQMQSVFNRIAIMSKGQLAAIGPAGRMLRSFATGYTVRIKLNMIPSYSVNEDHESADEKKERTEAITRQSIDYAYGVEALKTDFKNLFKTSTLTQQHKCILYFYIEDPLNAMLYSEMFTKLQGLKQKFSHIIDHYSLRANTIEDVFWRLQHTNENVIGNF